MTDKRNLEIIAAATHMANRAYCIATGDDTQVPWELAPEWQKTSAINGVRGALNGNTPEQSHESWLKEKEATGWKYGPVKNPETKEHPCFVPYDELPPSQRLKDDIFVTTARTIAEVIDVSDVVDPYEESMIIDEEPMMKWFKFTHLSGNLRLTSIMFHDLARKIVATVPRSQERTVALRKLLESKDAAVRAMLP